MSTLKSFQLLASRYQSDTEQQHLLHGSPASQHNNMLINEANFMWSTIIFDLLHTRDYSDQQIYAKLDNWYKVCCDEDFSHVIGACKQAYDLLLDIISTMNNTVTYSDFKDQITCLESDKISRLFSPISREICTVLNHKTLLSNGVYRTNAKDSMEVCSYFLSFVKKLNFTEVGLEDAALDSYLDCEVENYNLDLDSSAEIILELKNIITRWFRDFRMDWSLCKHGSGSVADASSNKASKFHSFNRDAKIEYLLRSQSKMNDSSCYSRMIDSIISDKPLVRQSKLIFVPKDVTKLRSISMEPSVLQYLQQGALRSISAYIARHDVGRHINLSDQGQNRALAYDGSCTNKYATLDLSHASDSVTLELVKRLFSGCPDLMRVLICTRSTHTLLPTGNVCKLSKFAPMGSALCFPVESIIFAAIAKLAIRRVRRGKDGFKFPHDTFFSVFGDDTIVPSYSSDECITLMQRLGFTLNRDKSYATGPFKESCGGNYFCGHDITGLKFKPEYSLDFNNNVSPKAYNALIMYANFGFSHGLKVFRTACIHKIMNAGLKPLFSSDLSDQSAIHSTHATNFHLFNRFNNDLQLDQQLVSRSIPIKESNSPWDNYMFHEWMMTAKPEVTPFWNRISDNLYDVSPTFLTRHDDYDSRRSKFKLCWTDVNISKLSSVPGSD